MPTTCPCPKESYCDLATNSCKVGCTEEGQCSAGRYCDVDSRTCKTGCLKEDSECGPGLLCEDHACTAPCTSCPDDGNPCTTDQCVRSKCVHAPVTDGTACAADTNECTVDGCQAGACAHLPPIDFTKCETGSWASDPKFGTPIVHACDGTVCVAPKAYCQKVTNLYFSSTGASLQECYCAKNDTLVLRDENGYPTSVVGTFCGVIGGPTTLIAVW